MTDELHMNPEQDASLSQTIQCEPTARTILASMMEAVVVIDQTGRIVLINQQAEKLFGYRLSELEGKPLERLIPERVVQKHVGLRTAFFKNPRIREMGLGLALTGRHKNGTEFPAEVGLTFLRCDNKLYGLALVTDITRRKQTEKEILLRNEELDAFAHTVAHDLNGSLTPIIGFSSMLADEYADTLPKDVLHGLNQIADSGRKMNAIIKTLLLFASMRKEDVTMKPLDMASIVKNALQRLKPRIQEYSATILCPDTYPAAQGVPEWVEEIWFNYLSNGLKYGGTPPRLEIGASPADGGCIRFWLKDHGPGMTPEQQKKIFIPFEQLSHHPSNGYGLGLSIVQRIVNKLQGDAGVESVPEKGSTFSFTLKRA